MIIDALASGLTAFNMTISYVFGDGDPYAKTQADELRGRRAAGISAPGEQPGIVPFLPDLMGRDKFWKLADLLAQRGHSSARIEKILGANFLRVAGSIWS